MTKATWLIKKLARELKYLSLPELFGRQVMIHSVGTVEDNIRHALGDIVPKRCQLLTEPQLYCASYSCFINLEDKNRRIWMLISRHFYGC